MRRILAAATLAAITILPTSAAAVRRAPAGVGACGLANAAFCQSLTINHSRTNPPSNQRAGALMGLLWGTADLGSWPNDAIGTTPGCGSHPVNFPASIQLCGGHITDSVTDEGGGSSLAMYPRQPFNFAAGGAIAFDVSNDSGGTHAAWPELWLADQPVPDPFTHLATMNEVPRNGFGIRFGGCTDSTGVQSPCPGGTNNVGVDSAVVVQNYIADDFYSCTIHCGLRVIGDGHSVNKSAPGQFNHYQITINAAGTDIEVYGTQPFPQLQQWNPTTNPLLHIATITGFGRLGFSQGLVWLEDAHYNANKFCPPICQGTHSFTWGNLGFTGPVEPRDRGFDVANNHVPDNSVPGFPAFDNAYGMGPGESVTLPIPDVPATTPAPAAGALLVFNFFVEAAMPIDTAVNGCNLDEPWPFAAAQAAGQQETFTVSTLAVKVPLSCVHMGGTNKVTFSDSPASTVGFQVSDIDLILQGAGGVVHS